MDSSGVLSSLGSCKTLFLSTVPLESRVTLFCLFFVHLEDCKHAKIVIRIVITLKF